MEFFTISLLNGVSYGLLLFLLSSGLTLIMSMMGVLNFAHASFYMLGAYLAYQISEWIGFWPALFIAPLVAALIGGAFERYCLRQVHKFGHVSELLVTVGLSFLMLELVQLIWGRAPVDYRIPAELDGPLFTLYGSQFPIYRAFMMGVAVVMLVSIWFLLSRTRIGLVIQGALTHPDMVESLGHNVPRVFMMVFGGGVALAALAGVIGGNAYATEPGMAFSVGNIIFVVVVVGGMGSLGGAFIASLLIGILTTFAVSLDYSLVDLFRLVGTQLTPSSPGYSVLGLKLSQVAPLLPYLVMVLMLIFRPKGLMGTREN